MKQNEASSTAFTVLQGILYTAQNPAYAALIPKEAEEVGLRILSSCPEGRRRLRQLDSRWIKALVPVVERLMLPGISLHYVLRKKSIEDYALEQLRADTTQIINLGAGFDTLAYRLATQFPRANFIEFDHPATSEVKIDAIRQTHNIPENIYFEQVDFTKKSLSSALRDAPVFDPARRTLYILEGVLMYIEEKEVYDIFLDLISMTHGEFSAIFTYAYQPDGKKDASRGLLRLYLWLKNEQLKWTSDEEYLKIFLSKMNYELICTIGSTEFVDRYLYSSESVIAHHGERVAITQYNKSGG